jgi:hypothetical protein
MIGLTIAMLLVPLPQEAAPKIDVPARCRAVALRLERTSRIDAYRRDARYAGLPRAVRDAEFARRIRDVRAADALVKVIRVRYPGSALRDAEVDALAWEAAFAEGKACRDGTR